jgi:DNA-binding response OmpR family regulator
LKTKRLFAEALAERLAEHGFEVAQTDTGEGAIEQLAEFAFDIVITDLRLPGLDGTYPRSRAAPLSGHRRHHRDGVRNSEGRR